MNDKAEFTIVTIVNEIRLAHKYADA